VVSNWRARGVPAERCPDIERVTGVRCERLRPDVDWDVLRVAGRNAEG
jgi:DNA-binding transcriptional regulator YdaS (Cro superfamily)